MPEPRRGDPLTERETLFLQWIADGLTYDQVARRSMLHVNTVRTAARRIRVKLGAETTAHAVHIADARSLVKPHSD